MACQKFLAQDNNEAINATIGASSVEPANRNIFQRRTTREGNGEVVLTGEYIGYKDCVIDIKIEEPQSGSEIVTKPIFVGAGNGSIANIEAVDNAPAQDVTITLTDLGTKSVNATLTIYGNILLQAKQIGEIGNDITIEVISNIQIDKTLGALSEQIQAGTQECIS